MKPLKFSCCPQDHMTREAQQNLTLIGIFMGVNDTQWTVASSSRSDDNDEDVSMH